MLDAKKLAAGRNGSSRITFTQDGESVIVRANTSSIEDGETLWSRYCAFKVAGYVVRFVDGCAPVPAVRGEHGANMRLRGKYHRANTVNAMAFVLSVAK